MALTPEQIDRLIQQADGLAPKEGSIFRALVKLTEAEVRKQDDALILQLVEALENHQGNYKLTDAQCVPVNAAVTAGRARMSPPATAEQRVYYTTPGGPTRVIWVTKDYRRV